DDRPHVEGLVGADRGSAALVPRRRARRRQGHRRGVAEARVEVLDAEDVREVRLELERDLRDDAAASVILDVDPLVHAVADEALALDRELVGLEPTRQRVAEDEARDVRRWLAAR